MSLAVNGWAVIPVGTQSTTNLARRRRLSDRLLDTATELLYRKAGRVTWGAEQITVVFEPYRYAAHQQAMVATCQRCNVADLHWRDGRRLRFAVASAIECQLCGC